MSNETWVGVLFSGGGEVIGRGEYACLDNCLSRFQDRKSQGER